MLGYRPTVLGENEYLIHLKERIHNELGDFSKNLSICKKINEGKALTFAGYRTEPFSQDGHNGGDYVIVVPDHIIEKMTPYYSELAVDLNGKAPQSLSQKLDNLCNDLAFGNQDEKENNWCFGSDTVVTYAAVNLVRDNAVPEVRYMLSAIIFPTFYALHLQCYRFNSYQIPQNTASAMMCFESWDLTEESFQGLCGNS